MEAHTYSWLPTALTLGQPLPVSDLPGFEDGWVSVQDAGAQLAAALLGLEAGQRVLDACAAPGGKTGALLESVGAAVELTAIDIDARRVALIGSNLRRLRRQARVVTADLRSELDWWDGIAFDRILLDAPCSATGVIRRHPDIKLLRRDSDIAALAEGQARLLEVTLGMLRSGGRLLYSTCSVLPAENEQLVQRVLERVARARVVELPAQVGLPADAQPRSIGIQLLPGNSALTDGFYYACLTVT